MALTHPHTSRKGSRHTVALSDGESATRPELVLRYLLLLVVIVISIGPFLWQLATSLKGIGEDLYSMPPSFWPEEFSLAAYSQVTEVIPVWSYIGNSVIVALCNVTLSVVGCAMAGYAMARLQFRGKVIAIGLFAATLLIPQESSMIALTQLVNAMGLGNTLVAVFLPTMMSAISVLLMWNAFLALPKEVDEAAIVDGASVWQRFLRLGLPSVKGTLAVVALLAFMGSWNDFLWPLLILSDPDKYTLTVGLNYLQGTFADNPRVVAAGTIIAVAPLVALFLALQRIFFRGVAEGGVKE
ncbi:MULTISPECIES: carbohydrate ABC transporter permease [Brachybacterium]|uniref:ABC transporter permease n=1 Tax=Brachybacterium alimentarium TaxID=47845 RepID=A0A2A3YFI4_9MICO|nr:MULTISPECIES: carbohydrate ABC transporter permease [Brachybacterium]PCC32447.1 ABC transporter permease [Brachybacterium alimentarium]PCC37999.1 ABC transporter permease [Brachybacterium alimentarium]RCS62576.1 carbohydrate ABC transporter permease [Brachybacterium sp. JB7]RCS71661.1 carbohydrate ABC transporter permease [Brachybacterium alimentarium]RCS74375.1 carbohydrate ABC transporter permease [Brachybacterium alimentarium]